MCHIGCDIILFLTSAFNEDYGSNSDVTEQVGFYDYTITLAQDLLNI
jgi:hypothetical protein